MYFREPQERLKATVVTNNTFPQSLDDKNIGENKIVNQKPSGFVSKKANKILIHRNLWTKTQREKYLIFYLRQFYTYPGEDYPWVKDQNSTLYKRLKRFIPYKTQTQIENYERTLGRTQKENEPNFREFILNLSRKAQFDCPQITKWLLKLDSQELKLKFHMAFMEKKLQACREVDDKIKALCSSLDIEY